MKGNSSESKQVKEDSRQEIAIGILKPLITVNSFRSTATSSFTFRKVKLTVL